MHRQLPQRAKGLGCIPSPKVKTGECAPKGAVLVPGFLEEEYEFPNSHSDNYMPRHVGEVRAGVPPINAVSVSSRALARWSGGRWMMYKEGEDGRMAAWR